jgi:hypothetical protein
MDYLYFALITVGACLIAVAAFVVGAGMGWVRCSNEAVRKGFMDVSGTRYLVERASASKEMAAKEINDAVRAEMRRGQYDADIARINQRNNERKL